jgi:hypothetical protein
MIRHDQRMELARVDIRGRDSTPTGQHSGRHSEQRSKSRYHGEVTAYQAGIAE